LINLATGRRQLSAISRASQTRSAHGIRQSLSRPRQVWDNAVVELFYSTLEVELVHRYVWATRAHARQVIFDFIEVFYNRQRRFGAHPSTQDDSPVH
jgi:transposase InsO family protein